MPDEFWVIEGNEVPRLPWFTRANAGETMPDPVSPLGWTMLWDGALLPGWSKGNVSFGCLRPEEVADEPRLTAAVFGGYFYLNFSAVRMVGVRMPGASVAAIDRSIFGEDPSLPPYEPAPGDESPECTAALAERLHWIMSATAWPELDARFDAAVAARASRPDLAGLDDAGLVARARSVSRICADLYELHVWTGLSCGVAYGALAAALTDLGRPEALNDLVAGLGTVEAARPVLALWDLSRSVRASSAVSGLFDGPPDGLPGRAAASGDRDVQRFHADLEGFLAEHGCRGLGDWDLASPSWEVRPADALTLLDGLRRAADDASPHQANRRAAARRAELTEEILAGATNNDTAGDGAAAFRAAGRSAGFFLHHRERSRGGLIKAMNEMRVPLHELARRRHRRGDLDEAGDLFLLLDSELDDFLTDPGGFGTTLRERRATYRSLFDRQPPFVTRSPIPLGSLPERVAAPGRAETGTVLPGIPGGIAGQATGRARLLTGPYDARGIRPGEVLVARQTDPSWTPLFVEAAAIVIEYGSPISHAVIVSRELGKVCVVSTEGACTRIRDGDTVLVDGTAGTVTVL